MRLALCVLMCVACRVQGGRSVHSSRDRELVAQRQLTEDGSWSKPSPLHALALAIMAMNGASAFQSPPGLPGGAAQQALGHRRNPSPVAGAMNPENWRLMGSLHAPEMTLKAASAPPAGTVVAEKSGKKRRLIGRVGKWLLGGDGDKAWSKKLLNDESFPGADRPLKEFMQTEVFTLSPSMPLQEAARVLSEKGITGAPVINESGGVIGVLSKHDLLYKIAGKASLAKIGDGAAVSARSMRYKENSRRYRRMEAETVADAMTRSPFVLGPDNTMQDAAGFMLRRKLNRVLVTEPTTGKLVGIVSSTDVFRQAWPDEDWSED